MLQREGMSHNGLTVPSVLRSCSTDFLPFVALPRTRPLTEGSSFLLLPAARRSIILVPQSTLRPPSHAFCNGRNPELHHSTETGDTS